MSPKRFVSPEAPLSLLLEGAGLEIRGGFVAHDPTMWANAARIARIGRVMDRLEDHDNAERALDLLACFDDEGVEPERLMTAARVLADPELLMVVADELLGEDEGPDTTERVTRFAERLVATCGRPSEKAAARWLSAIGRNETCWCGSGRKYKHCHLGVPTTAPLPERVGWLCRKAAG